MLNIGKAILGNDRTTLWGSDQSKPNAEITLLFVSIAIDPGVQLSVPNVTLPIRRQLCAISSNLILMITTPKNMLWMLGLKATDKYIALVLCHRVLASLIWKAVVFAAHLMKYKYKRSWEIKRCRSASDSFYPFLSVLYELYEPASARLQLESY